MSQEEMDVVVAMECFGGSFVKALAQCFYKADIYNFNKLKNAFKDYWDEYEKIALKNKSHGTSHDC